MRKVKFSKHEKVAGAFVLAAVGALLLAFGIVALKQGWLEPKVTLQTVLKEADGLRRGTSVQMAGLKVGSVSDVLLQSEGEVLVLFQVQKSYFDKIKSDSVVSVTRPFLIGEKVLDVSLGTAEGEALEGGATLVSEVRFDMMDLFNGRKVGSIFQNMNDALANLQSLIEAFSDKRRTEDFIETYDEIRPLVHNLNLMAKEAHWLTLHLNKKNRMVHLVDEMRKASSEMNSFLPELSDKAPDLIESVHHLTKNLDTFTTELAEFMPLLKEFGPEMPRVGHRAIEALDEAVVTLKAMQQSFLLRGAAKAVRAEEEKEKASEPKERTPAKATEEEP